MMMDLFNTGNNEMVNLLPKDGEVLYHGKIYSKENADNFLAYLLSAIPWRNDQAVIFGKKIITRRKVAWYGNDNFSYTYSNIKKEALPWTERLLELKSTVEECSGERFNACLLNLYHDGSEGMAWHRDEERDLVKDGAIASVSFGAARRFDFKHRGTGEKCSIELEHGSLLVMKGTTQTHWLHRLPATTKIKVPRVNLTFRTMVAGL